MNQNGTQCAIYTIIKTMIKYLFTILVIFVSSITKANALNDSLYKYQFQIQLIDFIGGKYKVYYKGVEIFKFDSRRNKLDTILLKIDTMSKVNMDEMTIPLEIHKKGKWSRFYEDTYVRVCYMRGYVFYVIYSSDRVKRRYRFESEISNHRLELIFD